LDPTTAPRDYQPLEPPDDDAGETARGRRHLREYSETILVAVLIVLFGTTFIVQNSVIPSASMEDTLLIGDYLFVNKVVLAAVDAGAPTRWLAQRPIRRGDVIVFRFPPDPTVDYIKRVVGLPGDAIEIRDKQLFINGRAVDEPYKVHGTSVVYPRSAAGSRGVRDNFGPVSVPEDHYFVLGDNRDYSADSREWRFVPRSHVTGKAVVVFWSREMRPGEWQRRSRPSGGRILEALREFPARTRWERIGRVVR
jgi:signal peptidase I